MSLRPLDVVVAETFGSRLRGLAGRDPKDLEPLLFPRCRSLHTFGMRAAIDIVWLDLAPDGTADVIAIEFAVGPRRLVRAPRGSPRRHTAALELAAGEARRLGLEPGGRTVLTRR